MAVHCEKCGARVSSRAALPGHYRRAHGGMRGQMRRPAALALAKLRRVPSRAEMVDVTSSRTEIVPAKPRPARPGAVLSASGDDPPSWWEPQADLGWRIMIWNGFSAEYKARLIAQGPEQPGRGLPMPGGFSAGPLATRTFSPFPLRRPDEMDAVSLWEQYYFLKALGVRLDAGRGTERDRQMFEAGLREYDANYDRIRAQRKVLPG